MGGISKRLQAISESATQVITAKAKELRARGHDVIGFGAGEPDFPTPDHIVEAARQACAEPRFHKYTPVAGLPELREAVALKTKRDSGVEAEAANVVVTNGAKGAVFITCAALLDPGDEALLPAPYWVTYPEAVALAGGVTVPVPTTVASGFRTTVDRLEAACTERTKMLIFVSPSNPSGAVYPPGEVAEIGRWAAERGIWVLTDEIYEKLVYGSAEFSSIAAASPAPERTVIVSGVAKTYAMTGWRVGWLVGSTEVASAASRFQSHASSNVANVAQAAALAALNGPLDAFEEMHAAFDRRRSLMCRLLGEIPGVEVMEPQGAFYTFPSVEGLLGTEIRGHSAGTSLELAELLLEQAGIAVVPGEAFGTPGYVRLSFAMSDEDIVDGLEAWRSLVTGS